MTIWWLVAILGSLAAAGIAFIWLVVHLNRLQGGKRRSSGDLYTDMAEEEVSHLFNKEFREELRNRGRLRFESIIEENAMFLKQDLDITTSQLNEYMKQQISSKLDTEFEAYAKAMQDLQELAKESLQKSTDEVENQRAEFNRTLEKDVANRKATMLKLFEDNMSVVIENYLAQALADKFDMSAQLPYIIEQLEANKKDIVEDMQL